MSVNFPGNPYVLADGAKTEAQQGIYQAIMALAFEVRTANLLLAAHPITNPTKEGAEQTRSVIQEVIPRLGLAGVTVSTSQTR